MLNNWHSKTFARASHAGPDVVGFTCGLASVMPLDNYGIIRERCIPKRCQLLALGAHHLVTICRPNILCSQVLFHRMEDVCRGILSIVLHSLHTKFAQAEANCSKSSQNFF